MVNLPAVQVSRYTPPGYLADMKTVFGIQVQSRRRVGFRLRLSQYCMVAVTVVPCTSTVLVIAAVDRTRLRKVAAKVTDL